MQIVAVWSGTHYIWRKGWRRVQKKKGYLSATTITDINF